MTMVYCRGELVQVTAKLPSNWKEKAASPLNVYTCEGCGQKLPWLVGDLTGKDLQREKP